MKKISLTFIFTFCLFDFTFSQSQCPLAQQWDYRFGGVSLDGITALHQTSDGGYILGGWSGSPIGGNKTQPTWGDLDYWIIKTNSSGSIVWDKDFGGTNRDDLYSLEQTSDGGFILGGFTNSGVGGSKTQPLVGSYDYWIVKTDALGNMMWDKDFGGPGINDLLSIHQTSDGGFILGGYSNSGVGGNKTQPSWGDIDYWIVKTDALGNVMWDRDFGGTGDEYIFSAQQTSDGGFILGGHSNSGVSGNKTQPSWGGYDYWIVKIDAFGNLMWDKAFGGMNDDRLWSISQTSDGGYILGGYSNSGIGGDKTQPLQGGSDYWIVKIDALGNIIWDKDFGGTGVEDEFSNIFQTIDGGYLMSGSSYSQVGGDKSENNLGVEQSWVIKTNSLGIKEWDKTLFTLGHDETCLSLQISSGCYVFATYSNGGIGGYATQPAWGGYDYWITKFCDSTFVENIQTSFPSPAPVFSIFPNPAFDELIIDSGELRIREIEIYNTLGEKVYSQQQTTNDKQQTVDVSQLLPGVYFVAVTDDRGNKITKRFIKM